MEGGIIKHCFYFLKDVYPSISNEGKASEEHLIKGNYLESIFRAGKASEFLSSSMCELYGHDNWIKEGQFKRNKKLADNGLISEDIFEKFKEVGSIRNLIIHNDHIFSHEDALRVHELVFQISVYFYKTFFDKDFEPLEYNGPIMTVEDIDDDSTINESPLRNYPFKQYKGSFLLNELSKLKNSSEEAVETDGDFSDFKRYLHVDRSIQNDFIEELEKVSKLPSAHLVLLCGSVGDGKSHLLAYLKSERPDLYEKFEIHNDATESFDPEKNALYTLSERLNQFNDENIRNSSQKFILAINLGVLNNFLESEYSENYETIKEIIEDVNLFDTNNVSDNITKEHVSFITFSDYHMFELLGDSDSNYVSSKYFSDLFEKISQENKNNPFYQAYLKDKIGDFSHPLINNYEMFSDELVQEVVIEYLIKTFIKFRKIISTRDLLNFVYEIIVPPEVENTENLKEKDFVDYSLPNLLFNNPNSSDLLKLFNQLDPTLTRNEELDEFIIDLNINGDLNNLTNEYFDFRSMEFFENYFKKIDNFKQKSLKEKQEITSLLIRLALFYGKNSIRKNFKDETYEKFLKYLYAYNSNNTKHYNPLLKEVRESIFKLRGSYKSDYICIDRLNTFKVFKYFKIIPIKEKIKNPLSDEELSNRFKTEINVKYSLSHSNEKVSLNVDYSLYEYILKIRNGFKPNKNDNENLINLNDFINNLLYQSQDSDLIIIDAENEKDYLFTFDGFDSYEFKED